MAEIYTMYSSNTPKMIFVNSFKSINLIQNIGTSYDMPKAYEYYKSYATIGVWHVKYKNPVTLKP